MADNAILVPAIATLDNLFSQGDCLERASVGNVGTFTIEGTQPLGLPQ